MKKLVASAAFVAALIPSAVLGVPIASAHDSVIGGTITAGEVLEKFPTQITLEFSAIPKDEFNTFAVTDTATGEVLFDAIPAIDGRNLTVAVPSDVHPGPGQYQVGFQITSSDGHATRGSVPFSVSVKDDTGSAVGTLSVGDTGSTSPDSTAEESSLSSQPAWVKWGIALAVIVASASVVIVLLEKKVNKHA